jgi:hypothetical protein
MKVDEFFFFKFILQVLNFILKIILKALILKTSIDINQVSTYFLFLFEKIRRVS